MSILNTSVSGMQANSNWLSSISQNVANSNTTGYKNVDTDFSSLVDQVANGDADFGGVATRQVSRNALQGNVVSTSTTTNLAVQGGGFFVVKTNKITPGNSVSQPGLIAQVQQQLNQAASGDYAQEFLGSLKQQMKAKRNESAIQAYKAQLVRNGA